jgi:hypothetical protein
MIALMVSPSGSKAYSDGESEFEFFILYQIEFNYQPRPAVIIPIKI